MISKKAQATLRPEWDKMQEFIKRTDLSMIEDILLDFARLAESGEVTNSDLQGIASVEAKKIYQLLTK